MVLAGLAAVAAVLADERAAALVRSPPVVVIGGLAALTVASALWTVGPPADSVLWGLVIAGYGAVAVAAGAIARRPGGLAALATGLALVAALAAVGALVAVADHAEPWAERVDGRWQPGGPFEYPPALALLQVAALPALLRAMTAGSTRLATAAAAGGALAAAMIALGSSRFAAAAALTIGIVALAAPRVILHDLGAAPRVPSRATVLAALGLVAGAGLAARIVATPTGPGADEVRLAGLLLVPAVAALLWAPARRVRLGRAALALAAAAVLVVAALDAAPGAITNGRTAIWEEAARTWTDRPLLGAGGDAYLAASSDLQAGRRVRYAHNLPLELGVEMGIAGLLLAAALYTTVALALRRAGPALWLLGPAVAVFLAFNLVDWTWHLAAAGALWAVALGGCLGAARSGPAR